MDLSDLEFYASRAKDYENDTFSSSVERKLEDSLCPRTPSGRSVNSATQVKLHRDGTVDINPYYTYSPSNRSERVIRPSSSNHSRYQPNQSSAATSINQNRYQPNQSSAAIIAAMSALQDKIRDLEHSKDKEMEKSMRLETMLEESKIQNKNELNDMRTLLGKETDAKNKLELEFETQKVKWEAEVESKKKEVDQLTVKYFEEVESKKGLIHKIATSKEAKKLLENTVDEYKIKYLELSEHNKHLDKNHSTEMQKLQEQYQSVIGELQGEGSKLKELGDQHEQMEHFVHGLVELNERLVSKVSDASSTPSHKKKTKKKKVQEPLHTRRRAEKKKNVHEQLVHANKGKPVPFLLGRNAGPSHSVYGQTQRGLADERSYGKKLNIEFLEISSEDESSEIDEPKEQVDKNRILVSNTEVGTVVSSLKSELDEMRRNYQSLLAKVATSDISPKVHTELNQLVERIENKAQQLYMVQKYRNTMTKVRGRSPLRSPKAYEKKVNSLRALNLFREILNDD